MGWAPECKDFYILVWTDNIFLVTSSAAEAKRRTQEVANAFRKKKLFFSQRSLEILPSGAAEQDKIPIVFNDKKSCWVQMLLVHTCFFDSTGSTEAQIKGRLFQGWKMFDKLQKMLCCPQILEKERMSAFKSTLGTSILWGSGFVAPLRPGWEEEKRFRVGGMASRN